MSQPKVPSTKRANSIALLTGSSPEIRIARPDAFSSLRIALPLITEPGPST